MSDFDPNRLRWGDLFSKLFAGTISENPAPVTQQIVNARASGLPESWTIFLYTDLDAMPPGGVSYTVTFNITLGTGAATITFPFQFFFGPAGPASPTFSPYGVLSGTVLFGFQQLTLPAKDIQVNAVIARSGLDGPRNFRVGAWVAPLVPAPLALPGQEPSHREHQWMGDGFHPEALRYK
jgi:hypothetical protein